VKTIKEFAERIKNYYRHQKGNVNAAMVVYYIEQLEKEYRDESKDTEGMESIKSEAAEGGL
jgi:hypothetical protein